MNMDEEPKNGRDDPNNISHQIIGAAINVHRELGPGLLESAYEACLAFEMGQLLISIEHSLRFLKLNPVFFALLAVFFLPCLILSIIVFPSAFFALSAVNVVLVTGRRYALPERFALWTTTDRPCCTGWV